MIALRAAAALAAVVTAMLVQATVVGPIVDLVPVSLPLVVVLCVAVLTGPTAAIAVGFGAGLLADLAGQHPVGLLALVWMVAAVIAATAGPTVAGSSALGGRRAGRRGERLDRARRRAELALRLGVLAAAAAAVTAVALLLTGSPVDPLVASLLRCVPAAAGDALLVLLVLPVTGRVLRSPALHPRTGSLSPVASGPPRLPLELAELTARPSR